MNVLLFEKNELLKEFLKKLKLNASETEVFYKENHEAIENIQKCFYII